MPNAVMVAAVVGVAAVVDTEAGAVEEAVCAAGAGVEVHLIRPVGVEGDNQVSIGPHLSASLDLIRNPALRVLR